MPEVHARCIFHSLRPAVSTFAWWLLDPRLPNIALFTTIVWELNSTSVEKKFWCPQVFYHQVNWGFLSSIFTLKVFSENKILAMCSEFFFFFFCGLSSLNDQNKLRGNVEFTSFNLSLSKMPSVIIVKQLTGGLVMGKRQPLLCFSTFRQSELFCSGRKPSRNWVMGCWKNQVRDTGEVGLETTKKGVRSTQLVSTVDRAEDRG